MKLPLTFLLAVLPTCLLAQEAPKSGAAKPPPAVAVAKAAEGVPSVTTRQDSATPAPLDPPGQLVAAFFGSLGKGELEQAYAGLTKGSKVMSGEAELRVLKQKTKEAIEFFGTIQGHELVETKPVGARLMRRTYISLGSEFPLRWRFYFYNANSTWRLIDMRVDDRLVGMFDETPEPRDPEAPKLLLGP